jgi:hypothetical protein
LALLIICVIFSHDSLLWVSTLHKISSLDIFIV